VASPVRGNMRSKPTLGRNGDRDARNPKRGTSAKWRDNMGMTGSILLPRKLLLCIICVAVALGPWPNVALALPGITPPPELIYEIQPRLRKGQAEALVLVQDALIEQLHTFKSAAGLTHLRFIFTIGPESHSAIMFEPDWTAEERYLLESGRASLVGIWETFQGKPSFTTKLVFGVREPATPDAG